MKIKNPQYIGIRLSADLRARIEGLAKKERRTLSDYVRIILEDHAKKRAA